jgi:phosphomannomutase
LPLKISVSGLRGIVGQGLDAELVVRFASAFGEWLPAGPVVVARDSRPSGPMIVHAVKAGLLSTGHDVVDAGLITTPTTEYLVQTTDAIGVVIVTASHNPVEWNALKLLRGDGLFLDAEQIAAVVARADAPAREHRAALALGQEHSDPRAERLHLDAILALDLLDPAKIRRAGLRVVVDCVEGAGGVALPTLLRDLGASVVEIGCGRSGLFPHDPEPRPDHLQELSRRVSATGADLGLAVDPDVDRLALVDRGGAPISEESTLVVAADYVLRRRKGPVVVNLSTTLGMDRVAKAHGVPILRTAVGEANVVQKMLQVGAVVGGEGNGGVILPALHPGRDALLGAALVLAAVAEGGSLRACLDRHPPTAMAKDKLALTPELDDPSRWEQALRALGGGGHMDATDGLRYDRGESWIHMRRSNTENALRIIAEAGDASAAQAMIEQVKRHLLDT